MNTKFSISKDFLSSLQWIRLDDLFNLPYEDLPQWVWTSNVVYYCKNVHNGKGYVGETSQCLIDRWRGNGLMNHQANIEYDDRIIYRALRKYGINNFILSIVNKNFNSDEDRKQAEIYWIKVLHTYKIEWGYNMTLGGDSTNHMNTPEIRKRRDESDRNNHGGKLAINSEESINKSLQTRIELYGDACAHMNTPEVQERVYKTNLINSPNSDPYYMIHSSESAIKSYANAVKNNGGTHPMNDPIYNEARKLAIRITTIFTSINNYLYKLHQDKRPSNFENYSIYPRQYHISVVIELISHLIKDPRWTSEMTEIFKDYIPKESVDD